MLSGRRVVERELRLVVVDRHGKGVAIDCDGNLFAGVDRVSEGKLHLNLWAPPLDWQRAWKETRSSHGMPPDPRPLSTLMHDPNYPGDRAGADDLAKIVYPIRNTVMAARPNAEVGIAWPSRQSTA